MVKSKNYSVHCFNSLSISETIEAKEKDILEQCETNNFMWDYDLGRELRVLTVRWNNLRFFCKKIGE